MMIWLVGGASTGLAIHGTKMTVTDLANGFAVLSFCVISTITRTGPKSRVL